MVDADPSVTLEEDLARRDFTINAMAEDADGRLVDPFGGVGDLRARTLRHVGPAFAEDPLRVLRAARFMARFAPEGFSIAPDTMALMRSMVDTGELESLVPERVWQELQRALASAAPSAFLRTLRDCGALRVVLPEVDALYGVPQRAEYHPEIDTGVHVELVCYMAAKLAPGDSVIGFAALLTVPASDFRSIGAAGMLVTLAGLEADARAYLLLRPYLKRAVRINVRDDRDPAPYWLVSTRDPDRLAAAVRVISGHRPAG